MNNTWGTIIFAVYLIFAAYFLNLGLNFINMPVLTEDINQVIFIITGLILVFGGVNYLRTRKRHRRATF